MPPRRLLLILLFIFTVRLSISETTIGDGDHKKDREQIYIVYLGHLPSSDMSESEDGLSAIEFVHHDLRNQVLDDSSSVSDRILRSYKRSLNGFAARLTEQEAHELSNMDGVVSVFPSRTHEPLTTRSWNLLGMLETPLQKIPSQGEVIVGMLDTGIWPDSPSFSDYGFGLLPPSKWRGVCLNFTCNKNESKIIGARAYREGSSDGLSPLDDQGHGSHTASTVAGREVDIVGLGGGLANGLARGAVPGARLAIYKVCWKGHGCSEADILAAFDDAIADGVDIISFSIGTPEPMEYFKDALAIGSFHAMWRGVLTSAAAGNSGLAGGHVCNVAPWMLSVAASSIDCRFIDRLVLGNGQTIVGASINTFETLDYTTLAFPSGGSCDPDNLTRGSYNGKVVLCSPQNNGHPNDGSGPLLAGVAGVVLVSGAPDVAFALPLPGLTQSCGSQTEMADNPQAPVVASFSSPGLNLITPGILKPDLSAPGIDIIASWSLLSSPTGNPLDNRKVLYNIISGTSMACPHASGAAAYVKWIHRDWSPAMIMSALITTVTLMNTPGNSNTNALKYGAGQLNLAKANAPGLVYDASESDYVAMLCAQGYNASQLTLITGSNTTACPDGSTAGLPSDLNYPTMAARVEPGKNYTVSFPRTVTNIGAASDSYHVKVIVAIEEAKDISIDVSPSKLEFSEQNQKISFTVTVSGVAPLDGLVHSGAIVWYNNEHEVRSPVVVYA